MHIWYDTKNGKECISDYYIGCAPCDSCGDCEYADCENYEKYIKGQYIYYTGEIGGALIGLISLDIEAIKKQVTDLCMPYIRGEINKETDIYDWLESFSDLKYQIGKYYDIFYLLSPLRAFYWRYVFDTQDITTVRKKESFKRTLHDKFLAFQCILEYINSCIKDADFYDIRKYEFANRYYFEINNNDKLKELELDSIDLNYNAPPGHGVSDFKYPSEFINDLNIKFQTNRKEQDERFKLYDKVYNIDDLSDFARISLFEILKAGYKFKKCENCGVAFIPYNRSDTIYCDRPAPQDTSKTCKEYGARQAYQKNLKSNEIMKLYRNNYMAKQMLVKRNPDIESYKTDFENYKLQTKQWKSDVKKGIKTETEFLEWLKTLRRKERN